MGDKSEDNLKFCPILSSALSGIIKHTVNDEFRDECFKVLKADNSLGAQTALAANLSSIIVSQFTEKRKKKSRKSTTDEKTQ